MWCVFEAQGNMRCGLNVGNVFAKQPVESFESMPRVAVLLRGHLERNKWGKHVSWRATCDSIQQNIVNDLRKNHVVDVYMSTYQTSDLHDAQRYFGSVSTVTTQSDVGFSQRTTFVEGLNAIARSGIQYAFVVVLRFDLIVKRPISTWGCDFAKVNFLWKENKTFWDEHRRVGDPIHVFNAAYLREFTRAVQTTTPHPHTDFHWMYKQLATDVGEHAINLILKDRYYDSNTDRVSNDIFVINRGH